MLFLLSRNKMFRDFWRDFPKKLRTDVKNKSLTGTYRIRRFYNYIIICWLLLMLYYTRYYIKVSEKFYLIWIISFKRTFVFMIFSIINNSFFLIDELLLFFLLIIYYIQDVLSTLECNPILFYCIIVVAIVNMFSV